MATGTLITAFVRGTAGMPRAVGSKNRNYPSVTMEVALQIPEAIEEQASGMTVSKLTLAEFVSSTPASSVFREMLLSSRQFGFTEGGVNQDKFSLTPLGTQAASEDPDERLAALRTALMNIPPYREFLNAFSERKIPAPSAFKEFLKNNARVPEPWLDNCMSQLLADARLAGFIREIKGSNYVTLHGVQATTATSASPEATEEEGVDEVDEAPFPVHAAKLDEIEASTDKEGANERPIPKVPDPKKPRKVFIAHGKNHKPLEELKTLLSDFGVPFVVVQDTPHAGRPISEKVATAMHEECSSAICIFSADERFMQEDEKGEMVEVWRPSQNAIYELGAASVLYGRRIILLKEDKISLPSDFSDIGHISFSSEGIGHRMVDLVRELRAHRIIEVVVADS